MKQATHDCVPLYYIAQARELHQVERENFYSIVLTNIHLNLAQESLINCIQLTYTQFLQS